jgi:hypothetical protein
VGLPREERGELDSLLGGLPLADWMDVNVTPLESYPNDPAFCAPVSNRRPVLHKPPVSEAARRRDPHSNSRRST